MAKKLAVINQLRPRIISQDVVGLEEFAQRISKNTTYNAEEVFSMLRLFSKEANTALQAGETVKVDGLVIITANMKIGGGVDLILRGDRGAVAGLNNPQLWTADKVSNHAYMNKTTDEIIALWNTELHPEDPVPADPE